MLKNYDIVFQKGSLLTGKMLSLMFDIPKDFTDLLYADRTDGIISGMNISAFGNSIKVSKGIFKYNGCIYLLDEDQSFSTIDDKERDYILFIKEDKLSTLEVDIQEKSMKIMLTCTDEDVTEDDFILCRFSYIPQMPDVFGDLFKHASYVDLTRCIYSASDENTFVPYVFKLILNKLKSKENKHPLDYVLMNLILTQGVISKEVLREYIKEAGLSFNETDDESLLKAFSKAVDILVFTYNVQQDQKTPKMASNNKEEEKVLQVMT